MEGKTFDHQPTMHSTTFSSQPPFSLQIDGSLRSFSLQINEKGGEVNAGYDDEKAAGEVKSGGGEVGQEPWMNNYVPYGKNPSGNPIEQVTTPYTSTLSVCLALIYHENFCAGDVHK